MKNKGRTIEFLTIFSMVITTIVGAGIYTKNKGLLGETGNPIIALILWIFVGLVCVATVYVFLEVASSTKNHGNGTIGNWLKLFTNRRTATFFSLIITLIYVPASQTFFAMLFISFFYEMINVKPSHEIILITTLFVGIFMIVGSIMMNAYADNSFKKIQVFGTIFKFIPLAIAFVAGIVFATMGHENVMTKPGDATIGDIHSWKALSFFRGFGPILFSFDGFVYITSVQKTAKNKDVVPKALMAGMAAAAIFYTIMALVLFFGTPNGDISDLLKKIFGEGKSAKQAATVITSLIMMTICFLGLNIFSYIGVVSTWSDAEAKLLYSKKRNLGRIKAGYQQIVVSLTMFTIYVFLAYSYAKINNNPGFDDFIGLLDPTTSAGSCLSFLTLCVLIFAGLWNRKTKKVKVDQQKGFVPIGIVCGILFAIFIVFGIASFIYPSNVSNGKVSWINSSGFIFTIFLFIAMLIVTVVFIYNEVKFKKDPFNDGFDGQIEYNSASFKSFKDIMISTKKKICRFSIKNKE